MAQSTGRVAGKKAFITGGAQGLGAAAARRLAEEGAKVSLADINFAGAQAWPTRSTPPTARARPSPSQLDVTQEDQWIEALEKADAAMGGISVLLNNAGVAGDRPLEQMEFDLWKKIMSINVDSVFLGAKHALKYMRAHQPGSIINISSIAGLIANHNSPAYNASKAGVWLLSKNIGLYCAKMGLDIRSNSIHPTFIDTPILDPLSQRLGKEEAHAKLGRQIPLGHIGEPNDIANAVLYLASDESKFMTAAELKLDGGISAM
jgi:NAD(P)-dependent dehydrogenase (short-subunit alcohol dehydrogenase family)